MSETKERIISQEEIERILEYVKENYVEVGNFGNRRITDHIHAIKDFNINQGFKASAFISIFTGKKFRHVSVYLKCMTKEASAISHRGCTIDKEIFSLEELKELESKAEELERFTLNLGLWK